MVTISEPIALPKLAFTTAWRLAGLAGTPHPVLGTNHHVYLADEQRVRLRAQVWSLLGEAGLARHEVLNPLFRETLAIIAEADREYYGWSSFASGEHGAVLVAARGEDALRVLVDDERVVLEPISAGWLPDDFVSALPEVAGAWVKPLRVPDGLYRDPHHRDGSEPLAEPPDLGPVEVLAELMRAPRDAAHQLFTAVRHGDGERVRSVPLSAIDLAGRGRVLTYTNEDQEIVLRSGTPHILITTLEATNQAL